MRLYEFDGTIIQTACQWKAWIIELYTRDPSWKEFATIDHTARNIQQILLSNGNFQVWEYLQWRARMWVSSLLVHDLYDLTPDRLRWDLPKNLIFSDIRCKVFNWIPIHLTSDILQENITSLHKEKIQSNPCWQAESPYSYISEDHPDIFCDCAIKNSR
jgi:hypothetical protein